MKEKLSIKTCPWWVGYILFGSLRKLLHNPQNILKPYILKGMTVMDVGCAMGFFSIPMAEMVGKNGKVIAVDLQKKMLGKMIENAELIGVKNRITPHKCSQDSLQAEKWNDKIDFALTFMMLHEVSDKKQTLTEIFQSLKKGGKLLFAEPYVHVSAKNFNESIKLAREIGFEIIETQKINLCRSVILQRK